MRKYFEFLSVVIPPFLIFTNVGSGQQINFSKKGKNEPPSFCSGKITAFDGAKLQLAASDDKPIGWENIENCKNRLVTLASQQITIFFPARKQAEEKAASETPVSSGCASATFSEINCPTQTAYSMPPSRPSLSEMHISLRYTPGSVNLSKCRVRGSDWIETEISGNSQRVKGTIIRIDEGRVALKLPNESSQSFDISHLTKMGIGYCDSDASARLPF